jgi:hypothetical protein
MASTFNEAMLQGLETWYTKVFGSLTYPDLKTTDDKVLYLLKKLGGE